MANVVSALDSLNHTLHQSECPQVSDHVIGTVYLLHFDQPYKHAQHYIGWTNNLPNRVKDHTTGNGSKLLRACKLAGIAFIVARVWKADRYFERRLKKQRHAGRMCPTCNPGTKAMAKYA